MRLGCSPTLAKGMTDRGRHRVMAGVTAAGSPEADSSSEDSLHEAGEGALIADSAIWFGSLEYSVLDWLMRPIGAEPASWGAVGAPWLESAAKNIR